MTEGADARPGVLRHGAISENAVSRTSCRRRCVGGTTPTPTPQRLLAELDAADAGAAVSGPLADWRTHLPTVPRWYCAGCVALACGALVEHGGDLEQPLDALLGRLPEVLAGAVAFADACRARAGGTPAPADDAVERASAMMSWKRCRPRRSPGARSTCSPAPPWQCWARSPAAPATGGRGGELLKQARAVADLHEQAQYLAEMLRVVDDEELLVLHPETRRGWKVCIRGVSDNFQLHTLLANALIGDPEKGLLPGRRPDPCRRLPRTRDRPVDPAATLAEGAFRLMNGRAACGLIGRWRPTPPRRSGTKAFRPTLSSLQERGWCCWGRRWLCEPGMPAAVSRICTRTCGLWRR